jgi:hypothetical protein
VSTMPDHMAVLARHPLPWRLGRNFTAVLDANGNVVIADDVAGLFEEDVGELICDAVNSYEERDE